MKRRQIVQEYAKDVHRNDGTTFNMRVRVVRHNGLRFPYTWESSHYYKPFPGAASVYAQTRMVDSLEIATDTAKQYLENFRDDGVIADDSY